MHYQSDESQFHFAIKIEKRFYPIDLNKYEVDSVVNRDHEYYCQILLRLRKYLPRDDYVVYVTDSWNELPSYGRNVFVIQHGIGRYWFPAYASKVGAVFKNYGLVPNIFLRSGSVKLNTSSLMKYVRDVAGWSPTFARGIQGYIENGKGWPDNIFSIPLGYALQHKLKIDLSRPRKYDIAFVGSISGRDYSKWSVKSYLQPPKELARERMVHVLEHTRRVHSDLNIYLKTTNNFKQSFLDRGQGYSQVLANSKISLVPRGDVLESFRYFESMRYGCAIVCEPQPRLWFYTNSPAIEVKDWQDAERVLTNLVENPERLRRLQSQSLEYWNTMCSEDAIAKFMSKKIDRILNDC